MSFSSLWGLLLLGYATLIYGLFKMIICTLELLLSVEQRVALFDRVPLLQKVMTLDVSTAGKTLSMVYVVFAVLTTIRAIERLWTGTIHQDVKDVVQARLFVYLLYGLMGLFLVVMYYIVIYTNIAVEKDSMYVRRYELLGICGGLIFITSVPIFFLLHMTLDHGLWFALKKYYWATILALLGCVVTILFFIYYAYTIISRDKQGCEKGRISFHEVLTLLVIPINIF
jgi:hypothetical protein